MLMVTRHTIDDEGTHVLWCADGAGYWYRPDRDYVLEWSCRCWTNRPASEFRGALIADLVTEWLSAHGHEVQA